MEMAKPRADCEVVEFKDAGPRTKWEEYLTSGMEQHIGSYHLCLALFAALECGIVARLKTKATVREEILLSGCDEYLGGELMRYLAIRGLVEKINDGYAATDHGLRLFSDISIAQLGFYVGAYGPVTQSLLPLTTGRVEYGHDVLRDGRELSRHCATLFHEFHTPIVLEAIRKMGADYILDLGCGGGQFLVDACRQNSGLRGVGLDIAPEAIEYAGELAQTEGLSNRLTFVVGDAFRPNTWPPICFQANAITAVGVLHEHFRNGEQAVIEYLNTFAVILRRGLKGLILGEPELYYDDAYNDADLFLIHIYTKQGFPRRRELWMRLFEKTELECRRIFTRPMAGPRFAFYDLIPKGIDLKNAEA